MAVAEEADTRLAEMKSDKMMKSEIAAEKMASHIRKLCGLLTAVSRDEPVDLSDPACVKKNKSTVSKLLRAVKSFKKKYEETIVGKECFKLLKTYGLSLE